MDISLIGFVQNRIALGSMTYFYCSMRTSRDLEISCLLLSIIIPGTVQQLEGLTCCREVITRYLITILINLGFVVPYIFKYSIKQPTSCTINFKFIALSRIHRSTCFGHCCAHHQEPHPTAWSLKHVQPGNHTVNSGCKGSWRGLLMMGTTVPETCWAVYTRQGNKF
jgi:hypothetical protein